ncbi:MAG: hypothetical protein SPH17_05030 [Faecalicoccus sp.]|nr:hypothetical protein [Faecalicoccus sp.]
MQWHINKKGKGMIDYSDDFLGYLQLKQDLLFNKIPKKKILYYIQESLDEGKKRAAEFKNMSIKDIIAQLNIDVHYTEENGDFFKVKFRAQSSIDREGKIKILLYKPSVQELAQANAVSFEEMWEIILAHECFHFLEFSSKEIVSEKLDSISTIKILNYTREAKIQSASEIAANGFAKELLHLTYLPNYYDYVFMLKEGSITYSDIEDEYQEFTKLF